MKNTKSINSLRSYIAAVSMFLCQNSFANDYNFVSAKETNVVTRAVKFLIVDPEDKPVSGVKINARKKFLKFSFGLFGSGPLGPKLDPHFWEIEIENEILASTDEAGFVEIPQMVWSQNNPNTRGLKIDYAAILDSRISGFIGCHVDEDQLLDSTTNESILIQCIAYMPKRLDENH